MMTMHEDLEQNIQGGHCVAVVGTGVSVAMSGSHGTANWAGLLLSGIKRLENLTAVTATEAERLRQSIKPGTSSQELVRAASQITHHFDGQHAGEFSRWMRDDVGRIQLRDRTIGQQIGALGIPILTTNYDTLLEDALGLPSETWLNASNFQQVALGRAEGIAHMHGLWSNKDSIILSQQQYDRMIADRSLEAVRTALFGQKSMVFIGFGEGINDPNFARLRDWSAIATPDSEIRHYRLCLNSELSVLQNDFRGTQIYPIPYGDSFDDLAPFLASLQAKKRTGGGTPSPRHDSLQAIERQARQQSVIFNHLGDTTENARLQDLLIPPVLLPVSQEQFVAAARNGTEELKRNDPFQVAKEKHLLIAGDENVGVSSALTWIAAQKCLADDTRVQVFVDYNRIVNGYSNRNLRGAVERELRELEIQFTRSEPLPAINLTIDNIRTDQHGKLARVIEELREADFASVTLGVRATHENEVFEAFAVNDFPLTRHSIGRMSSEDVRALARLADARRGPAVADVAVKLVRENDLPSTPFTFSMMLAALLTGQGNTLTQATSSTALLNAYTSLLLGYADPHQDARVEMDADNRARVLSRLAEHFVERQVGSITQIEAINFITEVFDALDWLDDPIVTLNDFQRRRILKSINGRDISFAQNSYLYLFAAKAAQSSREFLNKLLSDPIFYAPIVTHYAALSRDDFGLTRDLLPHLDQFLHEDVPVSQVWKPVRNANPKTTEPSAIEQSLEKELSAATHEPLTEDELDPLDRKEERDEAPFPLAPMEDQPKVVRLLLTAGLLSNVLRDTDVFQDAALRQTALIRIIEAWAQVANRIAVDPNFDVAIDSITESIGDNLSLSETKRSRLKEEVKLTLPMTFSVGGISTELATGKLIRTLERCYSTEDFQKNPALQVLGAALALNAQQGPWIDILDHLDPAFATAPGVRIYLQRMLLFTYLRLPDGEDVTRIERIIADLVIAESGVTNPDRGRILQRMQGSRLNWRTARLKSTNETSPSEISSTDT